MVPVQPGSSFLIVNLTMCEVPLTRASNVYVARWSLEEPSLAMPAPLLEELFPNGQRDGVRLQLPIDFTAGGRRRQLWVGDAVKTSSDNVVVIGRSALAMGGVVLDRKTQEVVTFSDPSGAQPAYMCPYCPPMHWYDLATSACVDLCSSYWFMFFDSSSNTCKNRVSATVVLGAVVLVLVGGEALLLLLDRSTWKGQGRLQVNN